MPLPFHQIEENDLQTLLELVGKEFGRNISSLHGCQLLSTQIEERTNKRISVNTLRRIFGTMPSQSKPSLATLDVLANYCDFKDYYDFRNSCIPSTQSNDLRIEAINEIYDELGDTKNFYNLLGWLLTLAFRENNISFLKDFFELKMLKDRKDYPRDLISGVVGLLGAELRANPKIFDHLIEHYSKQPAAQSLYFEWFVDVDYLNLRFFKGIEHYTKNKTNDESRIFGLCVQFLHHFLLNERADCHELIKKINSIPLQQSMHPFPIGRKYACNILYEYFCLGRIRQELINEVFLVENWVHSNDTFVDRNLPSFHLMISEAFNWCGLFHHAARIYDLAERSYKSIIDSATSGSMIPLKLYQANTFLHMEKIDEAKQITSNIDISNFDLPWKNFYWMNYNLVSSKIHRSSNPKLAEIHHSTASEIARHHNFKMFEKVFLKRSY